jgi:hypothetical protein
MKTTCAIAGAVALFGLMPCALAQGTDAGSEARVIAEAQAPDWEKLARPAPRPATSAERWMRFEREYGVHEPSRSPVGRMLQAAKYSLDTMTFAAQEAAKKLEFTYEIGRGTPTGPDGTTPVPQYSLPVFGSFGRAQARTVVTVHDPQTGDALVGLKLTIPFGS